MFLTEFTDAKRPHCLELCTRRRNYFLSAATLDELKVGGQTLFRCAAASLPLCLSASLPLCLSAFYIEQFISLWPVNFPRPTAVPRVLFICVMNFALCLMGRAGVGPCPGCSWGSLENTVIGQFSSWGR